MPELPPHKAIHFILPLSFYAPRMRVGFDVYRYGDADGRHFSQGCEERCDGFFDGYLFSFRAVMSDIEVRCHYTPTLRDTSHFSGAMMMDAARADSRHGIFVCLHERDIYVVLFTR